MQRKRRPKILTLAILTTLTALTWVSFEVWRSFTKQPLLPVDAQILKSIDPNLDISALERLKREVYLPDSDARRGASAAAVATPIPTETPAEASPAASPKGFASPSPTSSPGLPTQTGGSTQ
ncbi:hypothetical protein HYZ78_01735 [Candidatus Microgenomates bacterium]|nr:hypothetical protein [Candidatus Microgenomates bacterium]